MEPKATDFMVIFGNVGSDAGYWVLTPHGIVHVPGWNPEERVAFEALMQNYNTLKAGATTKMASGQAKVVAGMGEIAA